MPQRVNPMSSPISREMDSHRFTLSIAIGTSAASRPCWRIQPQLRLDCSPATRPLSQTSTDEPAWRRNHAVEMPMTPAPITTTSTDGRQRIAKRDRCVDRRSRSCAGVRLHRFGRPTASRRAMCTGKWHARLARRPDSVRLRAGVALASTIHAGQLREGDEGMARVAPGVGPRHPQVIVLVGATGDLARRKLLPGLFHLLTAGFIPSCRIIGVSLDELDADGFRKCARAALDEFSTRKVSEADWECFRRGARLRAVERGCRRREGGGGGGGANVQQRKPAAPLPERAARGGAIGGEDAGRGGAGRAIAHRDGESRSAPISRARFR